MADETAVAHDEAQHRFRIALEGQEAFLSYRFTPPQAGQAGTMDLYHTFVPEAFRGRGFAEQLASAAFEYAKAGGLSVIPSCPYISGAYLKRHKEYEALVNPPATPNPDPRTPNS